MNNDTFKPNSMQMDVEDCAISLKLCLEVVSIARAFPLLEPVIIVEYLRQHEKEDPEKRMIETIRSIMQYNSGALDIATDTKIIHNIFPHVGEHLIRFRLTDPKMQPDRVQKVIRRIIEEYDVMNGPGMKRVKRKHDYGFEVATTNPKEEIHYENAPDWLVENAAADASQQAIKTEENLIALADPKPSTSTDTSEFSTNIIEQEMHSPMHFEEDLNDKTWFKDELELLKPQNVKRLKKEEEIPILIPKEDPLSPIDLTEDVDLLENVLLPPGAGEYDEKIFHQLMEIFPEAEPNYLRGKCRHMPVKPNIDDLITDILSYNYPKRNVVEVEIEIDHEMHYEMLKQLLPNADPTYLQINLENFGSKDDLERFISNALEHHDYPTYKDYIRKQQLSAQARQYTSDFNVEKYLELIPNPEEYFKNPERKAIVTTPTSNSYFHVINFLKVQYPHITLKQIKATVTMEPNILKACLFLDHCKIGVMKKKRPGSTSEMDDLQNIPLLQLFAYLRNKEQITDFIKMKEKKRAAEKQQAKEQGLLQTCGCCYEDEVMPFDVIYCATGCVSCKTCIERSVEIAFGEGKLDFPCLSDCGAKYTLQDLQNAVNPKLFSKLAQKKQLEEVKAAGIEELEGCPFCEFATIPAPNDKLFKCLNPECMKESCRSCKEPSHVPLKCEEVEKDSDVKKRTYVEDKMTEALIRKCWKCSLKFIKADGCNKMTCSCGAMMCYVCNKPVKDYTHFNGQGGDRFDLCPLYSDTNKLHEEAVLKSGQKAKAEIGAQIMKIDPTADINTHYKEISKKNPSMVPPGVNIPPVLPQYAIRGQQFHHPNAQHRHMNANQFVQHLNAAAHHMQRADAMRQLHNQQHRRRHH